MALSKNQIQNLDTYFRSCGIEWYDVRLELIDHFATILEPQLEKHPNLNFKEAIITIHKSFGINGFKKLLETKTKVVEKQFYKSSFKYFIGFFKLPRIIVTITTYWGLIKLMSLFNNKENFFFTLSGIAILVASVLVYRLLRLKKSKGEKFLILNQGYNYLNTFTSLYVILNSITSFLSGSDFSNYFSNYMAITLYVLLTLFLISCEYVYYHLKQDVKKQFPNLKLAQ